MLSLPVSLQVIFKALDLKFNTGDCILVPLSVSRAFKLGNYLIMQSFNFIICKKTEMGTTGLFILLFIMKTEQDSFYVYMKVL